MPSNLKPATPTPPKPKTASRTFAAKSAANSAESCYAEKLSAFIELERQVLTMTLSLVVSPPQLFPPAKHIGQRREHAWRSARFDAVMGSSA